MQGRGGGGIKCRAGVGEGERGGGRGADLEGGSGFSQAVLLLRCAPGGGQAVDLLTHSIQVLRHIPLPLVMCQHLVVQQHGCHLRAGQGGLGDVWVEAQWLARNSHWMKASRQAGKLVARR